MHACLWTFSNQWGYRFFLLFRTFFKSSLCCKREAFWIANYGFNLVKFQIRAGKDAGNLKPIKVQHLCNFQTGKRQV